MAVIKKYKSEIELIFGLSIVLAVMHFSGIGCPIKYLTGISCAGCGMVRATVSLLTFSFSEAFHYHPLIYAMPFVTVYLFFVRKRVSKKADKLILFTIIAAFVIVYLYRMFGMESDIVVARPKDGLIMRMVYKVI